MTAPTRRAVLAGLTGLAATAPLRRSFGQAGAELPIRRVTSL